MLTADAALLVARSNSSKAMGSVARVLASFLLVRQNEFRNHLPVGATSMSGDEAERPTASAGSGNCATHAPEPSRIDADSASSS
jgi:hypothetical protein